MAVISAKLEKHFHRLTMSRKLHLSPTSLYLLVPMGVCLAKENSRLQSQTIRNSQRRLLKRGKSSRRLSMNLILRWLTKSPNPLRVGSLSWRRKYQSVMLHGRHVSRLSFFDLFSLNTLPVKLYLGNMTGKNTIWLFWAVFLVLFAVTRTMTNLEAWIVGLWARQYELRDPKDVSAPL